MKNLAKKNTMNLTGLIYFIALALIISAIFSFGFRRRGPWGNYWVYFIILFLAIWATDIWLRPAGPRLGDIYWFPPLTVGIMLALILAAASPPAEKRTAREEKTHPPGNTDSGYIALGLFFWIFLILLVAGVILGLLTNV